MLQADLPDRVDRPESLETLDTEFFRRCGRDFLVGVLSTADSGVGLVGTLATARAVGVRHRVPGDVGGVRSEDSIRFAKPSGGQVHLYVATYRCALVDSSVVKDGDTELAGPANANVDKELRVSKNDASAIGWALRRGVASYGGFSDRGAGRLGDVGTSAGTCCVDEEKYLESVKRDASLARLS